CARDSMGTGFDYW
nr:immunoglobulin heavy chain junction region [Macaca mulatta]MOW45723.1 immunoglobulin heavy chain junction region [Macaca mulatta]MOW45997.1 immunoglobulin heavy chain junction region [Macaca mulatta]MOW46208.1 immunoglobulin heavy chain junction region [Macaca mulatta]MOW46344.1 immunoglobulin heavy chain junction region [Macaca mulatta]